MKNFVKAMDKTGNFVNKKRDFCRPTIPTLLKDASFAKKLNLKELAAWLLFKDVCEHFLGNCKFDHYKTIIDIMLKSYRKLGCNISLKIHRLHSHMNFFPINNESDFIKILLFYGKSIPKSNWTKYT
jgi:hypothetical protein